MPETNQSAHPIVSLHCLQIIKGNVKFYYIFIFLPWHIYQQGNKATGNPVINSISNSLKDIT
jgi:hypothetical protein